MKGISTSIAALLLLATLSACGGGGSGNGSVSNALDTANGDGSGNQGGSGGNDGHGGGSGPGENDDPVDPPVTAIARNRYQFNNQCFVIRDNASEQLIRNTGSGYAAAASSEADAEKFFLKPSALGRYLLFDQNSQLLSASGDRVSPIALANAVDAAEWTFRADGDTSSYPATPPVDLEPSAEFIAGYRSFSDPAIVAENFQLAAESEDRLLAVDNAGILVAVSRDAASPGSFTFLPSENCAAFPEAQNNTRGATFSGTQPDGSVLGMADVHVHLSATTFLGGAQHGLPFHKFGITHALDDCAESHGPGGSLDAAGALLAGDFDGHQTAGWPGFPEWPARDALTHEAIYWRWLERAWKSGLRIMVNDLVENQTLCELQRNAIGDPTRDCNSMNNAADQVGTLYALQDYIDAQYGGRGEGWFRIVEAPAEARAEIADGNLAVVLGIEISNLFDCKLTYNPLRTQEPFEETGTGANENSYGCAMTETGAPNEVKTQMQRLFNLGVRQIITIHEFDNAFGGNGIFDDLVLNVGNRENSGGIPSQEIDAITSQITNPSLANAISAFETTETPTGEFWTTYDCPVEGETEGFSGYLFDSSGGEHLQTTLSDSGGNFESPALPCLYTGQGGRPGGTTNCYPANNQCNARWLTPIGLYTYKRLMEFGFIFDIDHLEYEMKTQALELAEAQTPVYPFVSTHGNFGGTSNDQAIRILKNKGYIYPSLSNGRRLIDDMEEMRGIWDAAETEELFAFGFGTDTNGLSAQAGPRGNIESGKQVVYPYSLFSGGIFDQIDAFDQIDPVQFRTPGTRDPQGQGRTWSLDEDGSAHYGMLSGLVQEMQLEGDVQQMTDLFNSAERYLRTWEATLASSAAINARGGQDPVIVPDGILRRAPVPTTAGFIPQP